MGDGESRGERLDRDEPEPLELAGGQDEGVRGLVVERELVLRDEAQETDVTPEVQRRDQRFQLAPPGAHAADQQPDVGDARTQERDRPDQGVQTHAGLEVADGQEHRRPVGYAERAADRGGCGSGVPDFEL